MRKRHLVLVAATVGVLTLGVACQVFATSYASQLTVSGSNVSFDLNESVAAGIGSNTNGGPTASPGDVQLILDGNTANPVNLGSLTAGMQNINLSTIAGVTDTNPSLVQVAVTTNDGDGYLNQINTAEGAALEIDPPGLLGKPDYFAAPGGLAVNNYPNSPYFGRIYATNYNTNPGLGIFVMNADGTFVNAPTINTASGSTETSGSVAPMNGNLDFEPSGDVSPWRITVGADGYLYISESFSATSFTYNYGVDRLLQTSTGLSGGDTLLGAYGTNHYSTDSAPIITGSTATGNLTLTAINNITSSSYSSSDGDAPIEQWNIGSAVGTPTGGGYTGAGTTLFTGESLGLDSRYWFPNNLPSGDSAHWFYDFADVDLDMMQGGPGNQYYVSQSRAAGQQPGLFVMSPNNSSVEWDSLDETIRQQLPYNYGVDYLLGTYDGQISPDGRFYVEGQSSSSSVVYVNNGGASAYYGIFVVPLLAGIPDLKLTQNFNTYQGSAHQIAIDDADNIYEVNGSNVNMYVWGPGGSDTTVTGSNGTFSAGGQWQADANGNLSNLANWNAGVLPSGHDQSLTFGPVTTAQRTVTVDTTEVAGAIIFSSPNGYVLSGGGQLSMQGLGINFNAQAGANTITAPVSIQSDVGFYAAANSSLTIAPTTPGSTPLVSYVGSPDVVKNGPGMVTVDNLNLINGSSTTDPSSGNLDIYQGKLALSPSKVPNTTPIVVSELSIFTTQGASLDVGNNDLIYDYNLNSYTTASPESVVQGLVASGGIFTSTGGIAKGIGLAVAENNATFFPHGPTAADPNVGPFSGTYDGQNINPESSTGGTVIVKYTYYGDLNFDGQVDSADLALMGIDGTTTTMGWVAGDLNYDGVVNEDDWSLFFLGAAAYDQSQVVLGQAPEPASLGLIALAAIPMLRRRRA